MSGILVILVFALFFYFYRLKTKDYIVIKTDEAYKTNVEETMYAYDYLKKQGKDVEIMKLYTNFSRIKVNGKMYYVVTTKSFTNGYFKLKILLKPVKY